MSPRRPSMMELTPTFSVCGKNPPRMIQHELWPLSEIDTKNAMFPCCLVWTPLPVVSWLAPFIGHVGICKEEGVILDFSGSNLINVDKFAFGSVARYLQLDREQCCFPPTLAGHTCKHSYKHADYGTAMTWDDALNSSTRQFENKTYNIFTCNCHSFVADCLNRLCYGGSLEWNMVNVAALILLKGRWGGSLFGHKSIPTVHVCVVLGCIHGRMAFLDCIGNFLSSTHCMVLFENPCLKKYG